MEVFGFAHVGLAAPTALLLPVLSHPRPRPRPRRRPTTWRSGITSAARPGRTSRAAASPTARRGCSATCGRRSRAGCCPSVLDAWPSRGSVNSSAFHTHESAAWPKPAALPHWRAGPVCAVNPHFCLIMPNGNSPRVSLVSDRHGFEFRQVWKVASSSLASFFYNMWGDFSTPRSCCRRSSRRHRRSAPSSRRRANRSAASSRRRSRCSRGSSRASRRAASRCPTTCTPSRRPVLGDGALGDDPMVRAAAELVALQNASDAAAAAGAARPPPEVRQNALAAVVAGFVEDIECGVAYSAAEHLASQLSFVSAGHAGALPRLPAAPQQRLRRPRASPPRDALPPARERVGDRVEVRARPREFGRGQAAAAEQAGVRGDPPRRFRARPAALHRLFQDFVCLGYPLPPECEGGRELAWLPPPPKEAAVEQARAALTEAFAAAAPSTL